MIQIADHPQIRSIERTGYPTWYRDRYYDEIEDEEEEDEDD